MLDLRQEEGAPFFHWARGLIGWVGRPPEELISFLESGAQLHSEGFAQRGRAGAGRAGDVDVHFLGPQDDALHFTVVQPTRQGECPMG